MTKDTSNKWNDLEERVWKAYCEYSFSMSYKDLVALADKYDVTPERIEDMHFTHKEG